MAGRQTRAWDDDGFDDRVPFLARLEKEHRTALLATGRLLSYRARDVLMRQNEPSAHVLLLLHGWTKVTALEPVEAVVIDQSRFTTFLSQNSPVALHLLSLCTDRQRSTDRRRLEWAALSVRERLAVLLLELVRTHGSRTDEGIELTIGLSQQELAGSIGSSLEAVARLLKELRARQVVATRRRRIVVLRPDTLRRIIGEQSA